MTTLAAFFAGMFAGAAALTVVLFALGASSRGKQEDAAKHAAWAEEETKKDNK